MRLFVIEKRYELNPCLSQKNVLMENLGAL